MTKAAELAKMGEVLTNSQIGGRRNIIINGAMQVAQRSTSVTGLGADGSTYDTLDRFKNVVGSTAGRFTQTQTADGPSGFSNCLKIDVTTADTSIAAGEYFILGQYLEGQDVQQLKKGTSDAEKVTVSFYVKGNASATYTLELEDSDNSRYNSQEFSVTTGWTRVTKTFVADTTGAFDDDNAASLRLNIWLHAGSNFTGGTHTDNVWHTTGNQRVGDNQTSIFDSTDRTFFITGVQLEVGSQATPFEHRSFGEELRLCQRYYYREEASSVSSSTSYKRYGVGQYYSATGAEAFVYLPVTMRAVPTLETTGTSSNYAFYAGSNVRSISADFSLNGSTDKNFLIVNGTTSSQTTGHAAAFLSNNNTTSFIAANAEL